MFTFEDIQAITQTLIEAYIDNETKMLASKAAAGAPEWELRYLAGKPFGAGTFATLLMANLKKREEEING